MYMYLIECWRRIKINWCYDKIENLQSEESEILSVINLSAEWKTAAYAEKKAVAVLLIDKIYIDEDGTIEVVWVI